MAMTCPSCGSALPKKSRFSSFFVCESCKASLVKSDEELKIRRRESPE